MAGYTRQTWVDDAPNVPGSTIFKANLDHYEDAHSRALTPWMFFVEDYGAHGDGTTDDTAAINAAVAAAVSYATSGASNHFVMVIFQPKTYLLSGTTTKGGATKGNAQIPLPFIADNVQKITLFFKGVSEPTNNHWNATTPQIMGTVLKSTLTGQTYSSTYGMPSIIGSATPEQSNYGVGGGLNSAIFSNICVVVDGIQLQAPADPTVNGFDFRGCAAARVEKASALGAVIPSNGLSSPLTSFTTGLLMPLSGNNDLCEIGQWTAGFWYAGVAISEHTNAISIRSIGCAVGLRAIGPSSHPMIVQRASLESCHGAVIQYVGQTPAPYAGFNGCRIHIAQVAVEDPGAVIVDDFGNNLFGEIHYTAQGGGFAPVGINGGGNLRIVNIDSARGTAGPPTLPSSGVGLLNPYYRDAMVTISGGTVSAIAVGGQTMGITSGTVVVPTGAAIGVTYSSAPSWHWTLF